MTATSHVTARSGCNADIVDVPGGTLTMGSTLDEVERCVAFWSTRLIDPLHAPRFRSWITKEVPRHCVEISALHAWKYPVTNGAIRAWGSSLEAPPAMRSLALGMPDDHPAFGGSVETAHAFARWYSARSGREWRIPTEAEWEWMAAGPDHREYPYGDVFDPQRANTAERGLGSTTPVDAHPEGASWCGVCDLAGNVEEWTSDLYAPYPGGTLVEDDIYVRMGPGYPIARGGSFALGGDLTRSARRHGPHYDEALRIIGFRLVSDAS